MIIICVSSCMFTFKQSCDLLTNTAYCIAASCVTEATAFQTACSGYIQALVSATGGQIVATTQSQITTLVQGLSAKGQTPTSSCCTAAQGLLVDVRFILQALLAHYSHLFFPAALLQAILC